MSGFDARWRQSLAREAEQVKELAENNATLSPTPRPMSDKDLKYIRAHVQNHRDEGDELCPNALPIMEKLLAEVELWRD